MTRASKLFREYSNRLNNPRAIPMILQKERAVILLSDLVANNPRAQDFWALERCVSEAARRIPHSPDRAEVHMHFDVEPEYRSTPRKWQIILMAAYERGLRARRICEDYPQSFTEMI